MNILQKAQQTVYHDRQDQYGSIQDSFKKTAKIWSAILDHEVTPQQVALCMAGIKIARESFKHKEDNLIDLAGYSAICNDLNNAKV